MRLVYIQTKTRLGLGNIVLYHSVARKTNERQSTVASKPRVQRVWVSNTGYGAGIKAPGTVISIVTQVR